MRKKKKEKSDEEREEELREEMFDKDFGIPENQKLDGRKKYNK